MCMVGEIPTGTLINMEWLCDQTPTTNHCSVDLTSLVTNSQPLHLTQVLEAGHKIL